MQFIIPNKGGLTLKSALCYYGAFFRPTGCEGPNTDQLVLYYSDKATADGIHAPFDVKDFLGETAKLANEYDIPISEYNDFLPAQLKDQSQMNLEKKIILVRVDGNTDLDMTNVHVLRPSNERLVKRDTAKPKYIDISTDFSFFIFTFLGFIIAVILGVQFLASAAPSMASMQYGTRLKSE